MIWPFASMLRLVREPRPAYTATRAAYRSMVMPLGLPAMSSLRRTLSTRLGP